ncbi:threonine/serine exporter family protein [Bacillaceae bacterium S4-13-58]
MILAQLITSFFASAGFGIIFHIPKKSLVPCGIAGMLGWMVYFLFNSELNSVQATMFGAFVVAIISQWFARIYKMPMILFTAVGIIPLVPGGMAYDAMRNVVQNNYEIAIEFAAKAFMISGSIAIGIVLSEVINQVVKMLFVKKA